MFVCSHSWFKQRRPISVKHDAKCIMAKIGWGIMHHMQCYASLALGSMDALGGESRVGYGTSIYACKTDSWTEKNITKNAPKLAFLRSKIRKFSGEGLGTDPRAYDASLLHTMLTCHIPIKKIVPAPLCLNVRLSVRLEAIEILWHSRSNAVILIVPLRALCNWHNSAWKDWNVSENVRRPLRHLSFVFTTNYLYFLPAWRAC